MRGLMAAGVLVVAAVTGVQAQERTPEGTYISIDDERLMDLGVIVPVFEYVEIDHSLLRGTTIETGYLHPVTRAESMVRQMADAVLHGSADPDALGVLEPATGRRIALQGDLDVEAGMLSWTPRVFAPTQHEPGRPVERESPFQSVTAHVGDGPADLSYVLHGDMLLVTAPDGEVHGYRRTDPQVIRVTGWMVEIAVRPYTTLDRCLLHFAETVAAGEDYRFSQAALDRWDEEVRGMDPPAAETWAAMRQRGLGTLVLTLFEALAEQDVQAARLLEAEVASHGGLPGYVEAYEATGQVVGPERHPRLTAVTRLHMFEAANEEGGEDLSDLHALLDRMTAQYERDPWSVTSPMVNTYLRHGWAHQLLRLMKHEIDVLCPER